VDAPASGPTSWQTATVVDVRPETARAKTFRLKLHAPTLHRAGQHYVLRLSAPDGYRATRSYSVASAPDDSGEIELTIERLEGGEVSSFLHDDVEIGDELEVRGPIGGWFVWNADVPAVLVGGGSGVVPLMAMLRLARRSVKTDLLRVVVSVRSPDDLFYAQEIVGPETTIVYTRASPPSFSRPPGRLSASDLPQPVALGSRAYVCGSSGFADAASGVLLAAGVPTEQIRVERFGPTG
jgi:ferredoxin-NADP reductase